LFLDEILLIYCKYYTTFKGQKTKIPEKRKAGWIAENKTRLPAWLATVLDIVMMFFSPFLYYLSDIVVDCFSLYPPEIDNTGGYGILVAAAAVKARHMCDYQKNNKKNYRGFTSFGFFHYPSFYSLFWQEDILKRLYYNIL
jgi:hypothetical protein